MKNKVKNKKRIIGIASIIFLIIGAILIYITFIYQDISQSAQNHISEEWIREYLREIDELSELDREILSKNLSDQIKQQMAALDISNMSEDDIRELIKAINNELQYANHTMTKDEISLLTANIVKSILESRDYDSTINELIKQLELVQNALSEIDASYLTMEDIKNIVNQSGLDESTVKNWILQSAKEDRIYTDNKILELAKLLGIDEETLEQLAKESMEHEDSITYLANKLDITVNKLNSLFEQYGILDVSDLYAYIEQLKNGQVNLQKQIDNNMFLTSSSITSISKQVSSNKESTDATIAANKAEADKRIDENKKSTDAAIAANKAETDQRIDENKKSTDAAIEANKAETDKKIAENKEYTDAEIKELQRMFFFITMIQIPIHYIYLREENDS